MPPRTPELQMSHDENSIPVSAKCPLCGEQMPQGTPTVKLGSIKPLQRL
jgi:hypothetical protein